jgi:hypothetical protein
MAPELPLRLSLSPIALAAALAMAAAGTVAPVPWLVDTAGASHCAPPCVACVACDVFDGCVGGCAYVPDEPS